MAKTLEVLVPGRRPSLGRSRVYLFDSHKRRPEGFRMPQVYGTLEGGREVLLTFDDGPHPKWTPMVLDALKTHNAKAVFFVLGKMVKAAGGKAIVKRAFDEGHRIGNHSYNHPDLTKLTEAQVRDEIKRTEDLVGEFLTDHKLFRPPYGAHNPIVDRVLREMDYNMVLWSVDSDDWRAERKPDKWVDLSVDVIRKRGHSVFLCHDIHPTTVNNLPTFLQKVSALPKARFVAYA
jgi:peptidoglycan-N-acetylglucosamine deacetylase